MEYTLYYNGGEKMSDIADNLKKLRVSKKFTQKEMAKFLGINPRTYQNYESSKSNPPLAKMKLIANKLHITVSDLFSPNYLVGDPYKSLRNRLIILLYLENQLSEKQKEHELVENQIQNENNPEKLRKLFEESKTIDENLGSLKKGIADCKTEISNMSENLEIEAPSLSLISNELVEDASYYSELVILNSDINILLNDKHQHNIIEANLIDGNLQCYKELFTKKDMLFITNAFEFLSSIKIYLESQDGYDIKLSDFFNVFIKFYSINEIGLDPDFIKKRLTEIIGNNNLSDE